MSRSRVWRRDVEELALEFGCSVETTEGSHIKIAHPSGWVVFCSASPSDPRALQYVRSDLRRKASGMWR